MVILPSLATWFHAPHHTTTPVRCRCKHTATVARLNVLPDVPDDPEAGLSTKSFFVTCAPGLEHVVAAELQTPAIGATGVSPGSAGVSFQGTVATAYRANLWLRCGIRVLQKLAEGELVRQVRRGRDSVYSFIRDSVNWPKLLVKENPFPRREIRDGWAFRTFSVDSRVWGCSSVTNSQFASTRAKDAICDSIRDSCNGLRPDAPWDVGGPPNVPLFLSLYKDKAVIYRDFSGTTLHKRGYRDVMHRAGLNEGTAAAILTISGWNKQVPGFGVSNKNDVLGMQDRGPVLLDPMCGSGTILIEAALMAINRAPGLLRKEWCFETWHDYDGSLWEKCRKEAITAEVRPPLGLKLLGNDMHEGALSLCVRDSVSAEVRHLLTLNSLECSQYVPSQSPSLVVVNPPWGNRIGNAWDEKEEGVRTTWIALGRFLKSQCNQTDVYVLSGNSLVTKELQLKADKKWPLTVGGTDCKLLHYYVLPAKSRASSTGRASVEVI